MTIAMSGLNGTKCLIYLDDIIVYGKTLREHNQNLMRIFERLREVNLKLNPKKCNLKKRTIVFGTYDFRRRDKARPIEN